MPTIEQDLQQIRKAVYGREVREAIADGIEHCYDDVTNGVTIAEAAVEEVETALEGVNAAVNRANSAASHCEEVAVILENAIVDDDTGLIVNVGEMV